MFVQRLQIEGYKNFGAPFTIDFGKGLNVLVGENAVGKSAIIDAIRSLLLDDDFERKPISDTDFYLAFVEDKERAASFKIECFFDDMSKVQQVAFLPWTDIHGRATLTLLVENKQNSRGRFKRLLWGGASRASMFEGELFDKIDCIYLPPLRDAEAKLREGRSSRLARLLKNMSTRTHGRDADDPIVAKVESFNKEIASDSNLSIVKANMLIRERLVEAIGGVFGQDTHIKFTPAEFGRIVESLRLFFFPKAHSKVDERMFRSLEENSLGYNNLLYVATVLAELSGAKDEISFRTLLIEEPEAHLHPQLQTRLLKYLEKAAADHSVQIIVTTHSPVLASAASLDSLIHLSRRKTEEEYNYKAVPLHSCGLSKKSKQFVSRWLDVTKSTLLFARGVILVEGIAEAMLLPELARRVLEAYNSEQQEATSKLPQSLEDAGVAVINMNGIYFKHFMQFFCNLTNVCNSNIPIRCSGFTDKDPPKDSKPTPSYPGDAKNPVLDEIAAINRSQWARLYCNKLKTFEYDLAFEADDNRKVMIQSLIELWPSEKEGGVTDELKKLQGKELETDDDRANVASEILRRIDDSGNVGKGLFAQTLADKLQDCTIPFSIPQYINSGIIWACGGDQDDA